MTEETRRCGRCEEERSISCFSGNDRYCKKCRRDYNKEWAQKNPKKAKAWRRRNLDKARAASRRWKAENQEQVRCYDRNQHLEGTYGITLEKYNEILDAQGGSCAGCDATEYNSNSYNLAVDHDHETDKVRGLLCLQCNRILGLAKDNPDLLRRLADYLERSG